jgi:hypothetical protein
MLRTVRELVANGTVRAVFWMMTSIIISITGVALSIIALRSHTKTVPEDYLFFEVNRLETPPVYIIVTLLSIIAGVAFIWFTVSMVRKSKIFEAEDRITNRNTSLIKELKDLGFFLDNTIKQVQELRTNQNRPPGQ